MLAEEKWLADGKHAAADASARIDDGDRRAFLRQLACGRQARQPGAGDEDGNTAHERSVREVQPDGRPIAHRLAFELPGFLVVNARDELRARVDATGGFSTIAAAPGAETTCRARASCRPSIAATVVALRTIAGLPGSRSIWPTL